MNPSEVNGRWRSVLASLDIDEKTLSGKHCPCPMCGGKDRFRFTDHEGQGMYYCNQCGPGDGVALLQGVHGWDFPQTMREIERVAGNAPVVSKTVKNDGSARLRKIYQGLIPVADCWAVRLYLQKRGLRPASSLKAHPKLGYYENGRLVGYYPAMVGVVQDNIGDGVTLHCTYIDKGDKAAVESPKKILPLKAGKKLLGSAVRLREAFDRLGLCEGIETGLAAMQLFDIPVWACLNANSLAAFEPPEGVNRITVFGDNDRTHVGQATAYGLAHRLHGKGYDVDVCIPDTQGHDWNDALQQRKAAM